MLPYRYVVVEGPVGVGKSSLVSRLADYMKADIVTDPAEKNPFLARFYQDRKHYALPTQLHFLLGRGEISRQLLDPTRYTGPIVSDFMFERDALFAHLCLAEDELQLYRALQQKVLPEYPAPDLMIYLQAPTEVLTRRIAENGVAYERDFPEGYLRRIESTYSEFFHLYETAPLLIVNTENLNFVDNDDDFELLIARIHNMRGKRSYFNKST